MKEINKDIFEWIEENKKDNTIVLMHCVSSDLKMGAGIAKPIQEKYKIREDINEPNIWLGKGYSLLTKRDIYIYNLITKEFYYNKPTYTTLSQALESTLLLRNIKEQTKKPLKIVMPRIGCGLDKLNWLHVKDIIIQWAKTNYDITVCYI